MLSLETMSSLKKLDEVYDYYFASGIYNLGIKKETQEAFVNDFNSIIKITERACGVNFLSSTSKIKITYLFTMSIQKSSIWLKTSYLVTVRFLKIIYQMILLS